MGLSLRSYLSSQREAPGSALCVVVSLCLRRLRQPCRGAKWRLPSEEVDVQDGHDCGLVPARRPAFRNLTIAYESLHSAALTRRATAARLEPNSAIGLCL